MNDEILDLTHPGGDRASILPARGFNCFRFAVSIDGSPREVLWAAEDFVSGSGRAAASGIPILFPFAGRMPGTSFEYQGRIYPLEEGDGQGNAIHGFVLDRAWRVVEQSESRAVGEFQASTDDVSLLERWPSDFRIRVTYELLGEGRLHSEIEIANPGDNRLPCGLATHSYFCIPPGGEGDAGDAVVTVPAAKQWELANLIPTGGERELGELAELPGGMRLGDRPLDNALGELTYQDGRATTTIQHPSGRRLCQVFDETFRHAVIYTPPHRQAMCIEPYTALPNAFQLEAENVDTGLRWLDPGDSFMAKIEIQLS